MKTKINYLLLYAFFALLTFSACQDEEVNVNDPDTQETIVPDSQIATFMASVTANYGGYDDILDESDCFSIELPVTIIVSDITIVIETLEDLEELEELFEAFEEEDDFFDFVFPITIIFSDYTEVIIENLEQLEAFIEQCDLDEEEDDIIECVDFVYPITFSVFDAGFNIVDTVTIDNDEALYNFLDELDDDENALIVSLNYPVTLIYANGETITVNSNQELADAIEAAEEDCDDDEEEDNCDIELEVLEQLLQECAFEVEIYNENDDLSDTLQFVFNASGSVVVTGDATVVDEGAWELLETDLGIKLIIEGLQTFTMANGLWLLDECDDDDELEFIKETDNGHVTMELELDCENEEDDCNLEEVSNYLMSCDLVPTLDGYTPSLTTFQFLENNELFTLFEGDLPHNGTWDISSDDNGVFIVINFQPFIDETYNGQWYLADCDDEEGLVFYQGDRELILTCQVYDENPLDCFDDYSLEVCDEDDGFVDSFGIFDLDLIFSNCPNDDVEYSFYETLADAENEVAALSSPYINTSNPQVIYSRVALAGDPGVYEIFEHELIVDVCYGYSGCTEQQVDAYLMECIWNAVNYNGSDNLMDWNFDFELDGQTVVIYDNETTIDASWSTSQSDEGVILTFTNVSGPNIQAITGEWLVVECGEGVLQLERGEDMLILERNCD